MLPMDGYATFLQGLAWALGRTTGAILELGAGDYSTPMLHGYCMATGRTLHTAEDDGEWFVITRDRFATDWHAFSTDLVRPLFGMWWSVVFVDHGHGELRADSVKLARGRASYVVVHDTQPEVAADYPGMDEALSAWPHRRDFTTYRPWTTVVWEDPR